MSDRAEAVMVESEVASCDTCAIVVASGREPMFSNLMFMFIEEVHSVTIQ